MKKKTKQEKQAERYQKFSNKYGNAIQKLLEKWDNSPQKAYELQIELWDQLQDSMRPAELKRLRDQYIRALRKHYEFEEKMLTEYWPFKESA